jgi:hypothetical protein
MRLGQRSNLLPRGSAGERKYQRWQSQATGVLADCPRARRRGLVLQVDGERLDRTPSEQPANVPWGACPDTVRRIYRPVNVPACATHRTDAGSRVKPTAPHGCQRLESVLRQHEGVDARHPTAEVGRNQPIRKPPDLQCAERDVRQQLPRWRLQTSLHPNGPGLHDVHDVVPSGNSARSSVEHPQRALRTWSQASTTARGKCVMGDLGSPGPTSVDSSPVLP